MTREARAISSATGPVATKRISHVYGRPASARRRSVFGSKSLSVSAWGFLHFQQKSRRGEFHMGRRSLGSKQTKRRQAQTILNFCFYSMSVYTRNALWLVLGVHIYGQYPLKLANVIREKKGVPERNQDSRAVVIVFIWIGEFRYLGRNGE